MPCIDIYGENDDMTAVCDLQSGNLHVMGYQVLLG